MLPRVLALTLALLTALGAAGYSVYRSSISERDSSMITLGIAGEGEKDDRLIDVCVSSINSYESLKFAIKAVKLTEDEAEDLLRKNWISGYIVVPENYASDLYHGRDTKLKFVSDNSSTELGMMLVSEIIDNTAKAGIETTNAIYGAQNFVKDHFPNENPSAAGDKLFEKIAALMLTRHDTFRVKTLGIMGFSSLITYMICGLMIVYLLLWGVSCSPLFCRSDELYCMLSARKLGAFWQITGEAGSYVVLMAFCTLPVFGIAKIVTSALKIDLGEYARLLSGKNAALYFLSAVMICLMQVFLYELSRDGISAPLLQFLNAVIQGYICGCFYPLSFFPDGVRAVASHLPVGAAVRLLGEASVESLIETVLYTLAFFVLAVLLRRRSIEKREAQS